LLAVDVDSAYKVMIITWFQVWLTFNILTSMNKLRKTRNTLSNPPTPLVSSPNQGQRAKLPLLPHVEALELRPKSVPTSLPLEGLKPLTASEQYWAVRALTAETTLLARQAHERELRNVTFSEEAKRSVNSNFFTWRLFVDAIACSVNSQR
jgi:hypothetical protein